nr:ribonuclease H-like domain-containing protein [Tanacetum cinerariifolium]
EKLARKNELKARGNLLMALPNEHQLKFNSYKSAKSLMKAIKKRFGGNKESKKVQKTLLKQQYENFKGTSSKGLDQIYDRNKLDLETLSMDDLYNNLKIYEAKVMGSSRTTQNTQNVAFVSSNNTDSTNKVVNTAHGSSVASKTNASNLPNVDSLSDMAMLTMRARRFLQKTRRNIGVKEIETIGFDRFKVECYNCHRIGYFARECRALKHQDNKNREAPRRTMPAKDGPTNFALMAYTSSSSSSSDSVVSSCSKACLKSYETLKKHYDNLTKDFNKCQLHLGAYKAGLESVKARLEVYKKNEAIFEEDIKIVKLDVMFRDKSITELRQKFEKAEKERNDLKLILEKFEGSSKNLSKLLDSHQCDKSKTGLGYDSQGFDSQVLENQVNDKYNTGEGYHAVPPPYIGNFMPSKLDFVFSDEHVVSESVTSLPSITKSKVNTSESKLKTISEPIIKD